MIAKYSRVPAWILLLACLTLPAFAQELFWVHREGAMPSKLADYEKTTKEFAAFAAANRDVMPSFNFTTWASPDFAYTFVTPIGQSLGGGDFFAKEFGAAAAKSPAQWTDFWHRTGDTFVWSNDEIYLLRNDLSYLPATERLKPEERKFAQMDFYFVKQGYSGDAEAIAAEFKALYEKKKMPNPYVVLQAVTGDGPLYLVQTMAKDPADYWVNRQQDLELLGAEGTALFGRIFEQTRKFDTLQFFLRPDLSLEPPAKK